MDNPHQGNKPPKPARVGGPHSGRRKPDFDDTGEQLRERRRHQAPSSLEEAARRVERQIGAACRVDRGAKPPQVEVQAAGGGAASLALERESSGSPETAARWRVRAGSELLLEAEPDFEKVLAVLSGALPS